jgi:hypothetical protein
MSLHEGKTRTITAGFVVPCAYLGNISEKEQYSPMKRWQSYTSAIFFLPKIKVQTLHLTHKLFSRLALP